jgi:anaerobic selenocysteine-containing dehydrogenase
VLGHLAFELGKRSQRTLPGGEPPQNLSMSAADLNDLIERLWAAKGESLVVCDSQDLATQKLVNYVNHALGNYGNTVDIERPSRQRASNDSDVVSLLRALGSGEVSALVVAGTDLIHNMPDQKGLAKAISSVPLVISFADRVDDFASLAHFVCPDHHPLESWSDAEPVAGLVSISQPTIRPLGKTRAVMESLDRWSGGDESMLDLVRKTWQEQVHSRAVPPESGERQDFQTFWDRAVHDGFSEVKTATAAGSPSEFQASSVAVPKVETSKDFSLVLYNKVGLTDSRHAHNPWLQELPDPVTKVTWDNYVCISSDAAKEHKVSDGDLVQLKAKNGESIELPVHVQRGQHDRVLAIALAYGVRGTDRFAGIGPGWIEARPTVGRDELVGKNAASFVVFRDDLLQLAQDGVTLGKVPGHRALATTQR